MIHHDHTCHRGSVLFIWILFACLFASAQDANDKAPQKIQSLLPLGAPQLSKYKLDLNNKTDSVQRGNLPSRGAEPDTPSAAPSTDGVHRLTLEEAKTQAASASNPLAHLGQLGVEAAKQHLLGAQADYFPKFGLTLLNFHFNTFMGQEVQVERPIVGRTATLGVPLFNRDVTLFTATATQPVTPLFKIHEAVNIARADERIARAKAGMPVSETTTTVEKNYFELLIAQCELVASQANTQKIESNQMIASNEPVVTSDDYRNELIQADMDLVNPRSKVKELTASMNRMLGWAEDTKLELVPPDPLEEQISLPQAAQEAPISNPEIVEAEQNVAKAKAASHLSKLEYVPDVAVLGGYANQTVLPLLPRDFSYIGFVASYNLFDFGKRENTIKERTAQLEMAETALQLTKAKVSASVRNSYFELERSRQFVQLARRLGATSHALSVKLDLNDPDVTIARAKTDAEVFRAEFDHRQAYAKLKALMGVE
jgi:outer membrane protein TolC